MGLLTHDIPDDRGKRVPAVNIFGWGIKQYCHDDFALKDIKRLRRQIHFRSRSIWMCGLLGGMYGAIYPLIGVSPWFRSMTPTLRWSLYAGFILVFVFVMTILLTKVRAMMDAGLVKRELLLKKRCASCAYTIAGGTPEHDGCVVCQECGAAWNLETVPKARRSRLTPKMKDDRGETVLIMGLFMSGAKQYCDESFTPKDFRRLRKDHYYRSRTSFLIAAGLGLAYVGLTVLDGSRWFIRLSNLSQWMLLAAYCLVSVLVGVKVLSRLSPWVDRRLIRKVFLAEDRCPSCAYALTALSPAEDLCVKCPECGAAWKTLPRKTPSASA